MEAKLKVKKTSDEIIKYLFAVKKEAQKETDLYLKSKKFQEDIEALRMLKNN